MELNLVKTDHFNGNLIEVYANDKNEYFMTREQIGKALEYSNPATAIKNLHMAHAERMDGFSLWLDSSHEGNAKRKRVLYSMRGCMEICRWSQQPKANAFMDKVWDLMEWLRGKRVTAQTITPAQEKAYKALSDLFPCRGRNSA